MSDPRFARIRKLIGQEALDRLHRSRVAVLGLGAVGSYAVEGLARAGVGFLRLVDCDVVRPSNINRQLYALESTLHQPKAQVAAARVRDIHPACGVEPLERFVHTETLEEVLAGPLDLVLDCIDSLTPKVSLLAGCAQRGRTVLSSMGAAQRTDPTQVRVGSLWEVRNCPLAAKVRKRLRRRGVQGEIRCVYSLEPAPEGDRDPEPPVGGNDRDPVEPPAEEAHLSRGRPRRSLGSLPTLTGIFGLTAANEAIRLLIRGIPG